MIAEVLDGDVWTVRPVTVIADSVDLIALWLAPGTITRYPVGPQHVWISPPGPAPSWDGWYVNVQDPLHGQSQRSTTSRRSTRLTMTASDPLPTLATSGPPLSRGSEIVTSEPLAGDGQSQPRWHTDPLTVSTRSHPATQKTRRSRDARAPVARSTVGGHPDVRCRPGLYGHERHLGQTRLMIMSSTTIGGPDHRPQTRPRRPAEQS